MMLILNCVPLSIETYFKNAHWEEFTLPRIARA